MLIPNAEAELNKRTKQNTENSMRERETPLPREIAARQRSAKAKIDVVTRLRLAGLALPADVEMATAKGLL